MQISEVVDTDSGGVAIKGTLSEQEKNIVVTIGLNMIYAQGLMSQMLPSLEEASVDEHDAPEGIQ